MAIFPNIPSLSSQVASEIRRWSKSLEEFFSRVKKEGGFVTRQNMVDTGLFDAELRPHVEQQIEADRTLPVPNGIVVTEEVYATNVEAVVKSRAWVIWNAMGPRVLSYDYELYQIIDGNAKLLTAGNTINTEIRFGDLGPGQYLVRLRSNTVFNIPSVWNSEDFALVGKGYRPNPPASVSADMEDGWIRLSVVHPTDPDIKSYAIREGADWATGMPIRTISYPDNSVLWQPTHTGNLQFHAKSYDTSDLESEHHASSEVVVYTEPGWQAGAAITADIINNVALLRWPEASGSYPIDLYELRKGTDFATAEVVCKVKGTAFQVIETVAGQYKYWVVAIDKAKMTGTPLSIYLTLSAPPDFILRDHRSLDFTAGTRTNCVIDPATGHLIAPVAAAETFAEHFIREGTEQAPTWDGPGEQVAAGYELFIQPGTTLISTYVHVIDYQQVYGGSKITLDVTRTTPAGTVTITPKISISTDNVSWTDYDGVYQAFAASFRYVKITLTFDTADSGIMDVALATVRLDVKYNTYSIAVNVVNTTGEGDQIDFADYDMSFIDPPHVFASPPFLGTVADPVSVIAPHSAVTTTHCHVYAFNSSGSRIALSGANVALLLIRGI